MAVSFVKGSPALLVEEEKLLVVGDLHIGTEFKLNVSGMYFPNASRKMGEELLGIYKKSGARGLVLLGDVKDSIAYPSKDEYTAISDFFYVIRQLSITVVRGNHDAHLGELLQRLKIQIEIVPELMLSKTALIHGNALPSVEAMDKEYIISAHSHIAAEINQKVQKAWLIAGIGKDAKKEYKSFNKKAKLVVMPAFNSLIIGMKVNREMEWHMPLLRKRIFDPDNAKIYDLEGDEVGSMD